MANKADLIKQAKDLGISQELIDEQKNNAGLEAIIAAKKAELGDDGTEATEGATKEQKQPEATINAQARPKKSEGLAGVHPEHKMRLYRKGGKVVFWNIEEALKPYNFKQLSEKSQQAITKGKSATKILMDVEAEMNEVNGE